jgi:hypothetical protein
VAEPGRPADRIGGRGETGCTVAATAGTSPVP